MMEVPKITIVREGRSPVFRAVIGTLAAKEAAVKAGLDPTTTEVVLQEYSYQFLGTTESDILMLTQLMFRRGVEWAREHMNKELGG